MPLPDHELLRLFASSADEAAFGEVVRRRIDFVYAAALRQLSGDTHLAQDVVQKVFIKLARSAGKLADHPALLGWLSTTTRFTAIDLIRSEQRRKSREEEIMTTHTEAETDWSRLQPVLDEALHQLPEPDREIVFARYFNRQPFAQIASELGVTENAAQRRVERALDKLRVALGRRDITSTSAALGLILASQPMIAAPLGLATAVTQSALLASAAGGAVAGWSIFMTSQKIVAGLCVISLVGIGTAFLGARVEAESRLQLAASQAEEKTMASRLRTLQQRGEVEVRRARLAEQENGLLLENGRALQAAAVTEAPLPVENITTELVEKRFKLAKDLIENGDPAAALRELIWCYDVGMPNVSRASLRMTRDAMVPMLFVKLGERYPAALTALRERRDRAEKLAMTDDKNSDAIGEFARINQVLKDDGLSIAVLEALPPGDSRRRTLASAAYDSLIENRRYALAAEGRNYPSISALFETLSHQPLLSSNSPSGEEGRKNFRESLVALMGKNIEMLAGKGDLVHARALADRVIAFDPSPKALAVIQRHAERAGQPGLLKTPETAAP